MEASVLIDLIEQGLGLGTHDARIEVLGIGGDDGRLGSVVVLIILRRSRAAEGKRIEATREVKRKSYHQTHAAHDRLIAIAPHVSPHSPQPL